MSVLPIHPQDDDDEQRELYPNAGAEAMELMFAASFLDDVERVRIATENRMRSMVQSGLPIDMAPYEIQVAAFAAIELQAVKNLQKAMKRHPLGDWVQATVGVGLKQGARLIAAIGDVAYNHSEDRPRRGPAELWAYCGYVPGQKRQKGQKANWSAEAKMRAFLIAESCIKQTTSPYRADYDRMREHYESAVHDTPCVRCGPSGHPAQPGSPWSKGHQHAAALRYVAKRVLKDMFVEAKRVGS